jgi:CRISPR system Cascade subunit CasB
MSTFLEWLESLNQRDTRVRAVLRRSLAFAPGAFPAAFPYVESFLKEDAANWRREVHYLVAALWAMHWKEGRADALQPIGKAAALYAMGHHTREQLGGGASSTERRFIALLDADPEQLPYRLRQMIALLKDEAIDFGALLIGLQRWQDETKRTQNAWARDFYRALNRETELEQESETEEQTA